MDLSSEFHLESILSFLFYVEFQTDIQTPSLKICCPRLAEPVRCVILPPSGFLLNRCLWLSLALLKWDVSFLFCSVLLQLQVFYGTQWSQNSCSACAFVTRCCHFLLAACLQSLALGWFHLIYASCLCGVSLLFSSPVLWSRPVWFNWFAHKVHPIRRSGFPVLPKKAKADAAETPGNSWSLVTLVFTNAELIGVCGMGFLAAEAYAWGFAGAALPSSGSPKQLRSTIGQMGFERRFKSLSVSHKQQSRMRLQKLWVLCHALPRFVIAMLCSPQPAFLRFCTGIAVTPGVCGAAFSGLMGKAKTPRSWKHFVSDLLHERFDGPTSRTPEKSLCMKQRKRVKMCPPNQPHAGLKMSAFWLFGRSCSITFLHPCVRMWFKTLITVIACYCILFGCTWWIVSCTSFLNKLCSGPAEQTSLSPCSEALPPLSQAERFAYSHMDTLQAQNDASSMLSIVYEAEFTCGLENQITFDFCSGLGLSKVKPLQGMCSHSLHALLYLFCTMLAFEEQTTPYILHITASSAAPPTSMLRHLLLTSSIENLTTTTTAAVTTAFATTK